MGGPTISLINEKSQLANYLIFLDKQITYLVFPEKKKRKKKLHAQFPSLYNLHGIKLNADQKVWKLVISCSYWFLPHYANFSNWKDEGTLFRTCGGDEGTLLSDHV